MINSIDKLVEIAQARNSQHMDTIMPIQYKTKDGFLHVLPGDDFYPENPDLHETSHDVEKFSDKTFEETRKMTKNFCRSEQTSLYEVRLLSNVEPADGHFSQVVKPRGGNILETCFYCP
jgi:nucleoside diphosphate-linked moiety X motif 19, mitochondrial